MAYGTLGDSYIDELLAEYGVVTGSVLEDFAENETNALLYAAVLELQAARKDPGSSDIEVSLGRDQDRNDIVATYDALSNESLSERQNTATEDWEIMDLGFVSSEVDLRFNKSIIVAFANPTDPTNRIRYNANRSPVTGIPTRTNKIFAVAQDGTGGATVSVEAWANR